jgi:hypothetical protein
MFVGNGNSVPMAKDRFEQYPDGIRHILYVISVYLKGLRAVIPISLIVYDKIPFGILLEIHTQINHPLLLFLYLQSGS